MTEKKNFRNFKDAEQYLYKISKLVIDGKISSAQAAAYSRIVDSWARVHKLKESAEILRRLDGVETMIRKQKGLK